ncbi:hypothetical protein HBI23_257720 [Parastagonospora nodorum]|nr:hypothetical protein HBI23_257720 [Parastagonospora nodorum]KAH5618984.1 hypothetical protein HBI51_252770 [Parastagonospora nodorum]KAH5982897.1 hypothetical protein HBI84_250170 [Parastagonospora nodorum]KAH6132275.1 hypothetical protein HBI68_255880 [Parastagonospora nodorum]KAH6379102.1 hypothetical protein HBI08_242310 [Parastagonospora nodorum]
MYILVCLLVVLVPVLVASLARHTSLRVEPRECTDSRLLRKLLEGYLGMGECVLTCLEFAINRLDIQNLPVGSKRYMTSEKKK